MANNDVDYMLHFTKLIWHSFESMIQSLKALGADNNNIHSIMDLRLDIIGHKRKGVVTIYFPYTGEDWYFWAILGAVSYEGLCVLIINSSVLQTIEGSPEHHWLASFANHPSYAFIDKLKTESKT